MKHPISLILAIATGLMAPASPQSHAQAIETEPAGSQEGPPPEPQAPPVVTEQSVDEAIQVIRSRAATIGTPQGLSQLPGLQGESPQEVGASMVRQITSRQRQVHDLAWPLLVGGSQAGLCKSAWKTGLLLSTFLPSKGEALVETVASGSPASEAGLRENDAITAIGGKQVRSIKVAQGQLEKASETPTAVQLSVRRGGERFTVAVTPVKACDLEVGVFDGSNSFMDTGTTGVIQIDPNAWQAVQSDQDRQIIIAHQVGHHATGHVATRQTLSKIGRFADMAAGYVGMPTGGMLGAVGALATKGGDEKEADAASLKLLATIGITPQETLSFWERATSSSGGTIQRLMTAHPMSEGRLNALRSEAPASGVTAEMEPAPQSEMSISQ